MPAEDHEPITAPRLADLFRDNAAGLAGAARGVLGPGVDAQELLQDAFLKAWEAIRRGAYPRDPVAWVFVVTMNLARDRRRSARAVAPLADRGVDRVRDAGRDCSCRQSGA